MWLNLFQRFLNWFFMSPAKVSLLAMLIVISLLSCKKTLAFAAYAQASPAVDKTKESPPTSSQDTQLPRPAHKHTAFGERQAERLGMVDWQIRKRGIADPNVLTALETVPRHVFVRRGDLRQAYNDHPLPIGSGQTISQPYIVAYMTEALNLKPHFKVLEIGTGSGYQAAVCAEIAAQVHTIEILQTLAESAEKRLKELGYLNVFVKNADGYYGWPDKAPFDAIIITCATGFVPPPLIEQLKPGGIMILPLGSSFGYQVLVIITKDDKGKTSSKELLPVRFVPMLGRTERGR
jgi:protein-L-isoaspartate(D-aspartate) O-methyltransferase